MTGQRPDFIPPARPIIGEAEIEAAVRVLRSGMVVQGPEVAAFEQEFGEVVAGRHCVAVNSGTSALQLTLLALGVGPGDEVIVPSFSFAASANAVRLVGAEVVFADIERDSFCLDPDAVAAAVTPRTVAVMPVHLYGHPAAMDKIMAVAERHGLAVVEDAAQAHGAGLHGTPVGAFGIAGCFSFYPTKNMHSLEGGMISTADAGFARTLRLLRNQGMEQRYANEIVGANMRMTDVAAAIGRVQLTQLAEWTAQRQANAKYLDSKITNMITPPVADAARHVYHQYTVRVRGDRDAAQERLTEQGIGNAVYYPTPIHRLKPYLGADGRPGPWELPETDRAAAEVISLPVHPTLEQSDLERIADAANLAGGAQ
ncbi:MULTISPECIES: DegT/DnrJ/EryC1/StrS family aminotransferase [Micromonospora]|uniref:DegT/DnrJ/EryC1/StrS family aminotransferase n=1 Tax=Micromonospora craniellae TaxID=2294034 RepID=A0A372G2I7_9ACTN|nr:DegT/DnrJ/EryC1/StrS family aminotransferase [Micromonospora craniellae]QOC92783.1 DegT/DnrJ/EryC1/StrS family aminotransferase [Micromonospora craniellae]RFS46930.1 DegT/DnrJ/EryC1/StrS family aminotransferase [Micromonospora craniellae]